MYTRDRRRAEKGVKQSLKQAFSGLNNMACSWRSSTVLACYGFCWKLGWRNLPL